MLRRAIRTGLESRALLANLPQVREEARESLAGATEALRESAEIHGLFYAEAVVERLGTVVAPDSVDVGPRFGCASILKRRIIAPGDAAALEYRLFPTPHWDADARREVR